MSMYREQIMDHYKNPRNFGELKDADVSLEIDNPLCGDKLILQIKYKSPPARGGVGGVGEEPSANPTPTLPLVRGGRKKGESEASLFSCPPPLLKGELEGVLDDVVADVKFSGTGCAISTASASLLTEYLKNKTCAELEAINEDAIYELLGVEINPGRAKCALLPLLALREGVRPARRSLGEGGVR